MHNATIGSRQSKLISLGSSGCCRHDDDVAEPLTTSAPGSLAGRPPAGRRSHTDTHYSLNFPTVLRSVLTWVLSVAAASALVWALSLAWWVLRLILSTDLVMVALADSCS